MKRSFFSLLLLLSVVRVSANDEGRECNDSFWSRLIPHYAQAQYAGSVGAASAGFGWNYGRQDQWETAIIGGVIPKGAYEKIIPTLTVKESYVPWNIAIGESRFSVTPLTCGFFINFAFDENLWVKEPDRYNPPYYRFPTMVTANIFLGQRVNYRLDKSVVKSLSFYYELSVSDLHLISAISNSCLRPRDYLSLALGVKVNFKGRK